MTGWGFRKLAGTTQHNTHRIERFFIVTPFMSAMMYCSSSYYYYSKLSSFITSHLHHSILLLRLFIIREFEANVIILHHSTTICCGYQPVVHCGVLRQSAEMIEIKGRENLKTGESKTLH